MNDNLGKSAEKKIQEWLDRPEAGYDFQRIPDQMTGFYGSSNICDFVLYKYPYHYWIESKATWESRFDFSRITDIQYNGLLVKSRISGVYGVVVVLFASHKRAILIDIQQIKSMIDSGKKSINIDKIDKWDFRYSEIPTIPNSRKKLLDYAGKFEDIFETAVCNFDPTIRHEAE